MAEQFRFGTRTTDGARQSAPPLSWAGLRAHWQPLLAAASLALAVIALFATAPKHEDFWWSDAATFALNGELIRDYVASGMKQSPLAFANDWFAHYPALTISLYPPIFPMVEAAVFAVFGFSHVAAQATVAGFTALAACGLYLSMRRAIPPLAAAGAGLMMLAAPGVLLWGRQVMMEVPSVAFCLLASASLLRYQAEKARKWLFLAVLLTLAAVYTKQPTIFLAFAFAGALIVDEGAALVRRRDTWLAAGLGAIGVLPLTVFTFFVPQTVETLLRDSTTTAAAVPLFVAYVEALPDIVGWPLLAGALGYLILVAIRGLPRGEERRLVILMLAWFVADFIFISVTAHFEARFGMALAIPPAVFSALLLARLGRSEWRAAPTLIVGVALCAAGLATNRVPTVKGYDKVAAFVLDRAAQNGTVLFQGLDSKNFVFSIRRRSPAVPKISILRAEKFLVDYSIFRQWGISDRNLSASQIEAILDRNHVSLVVLEPNFWTDQPSIARLQALVYSPRFKEIAEFPITSDIRSKNKVIKVFEKVP